MSSTKIVATIGPATRDRETLLELSEMGMGIARLNGSHNTLEWHSETIELLRKTLPNLPILLDIPGRKIRTIDLAHEPQFETGDEIILTTDLDHDGSRKVPVNYPDFHEDISAGATILADDGTLRFTVVETDASDIVCRAENNGQLKSRKGINVPFIKLNTKEVTDKDRAMVDFARKCGVDFIGISFVSSAAHVHAIRELTKGSWPRIVAKIENLSGLENMAEVIDAADAIMIDRGDLSVETNLESVAVFQKRILETATQNGKPVIVATEMLHTMIDNPFPTKAEVSDISNAVLDGASATMLSGETAIGEHAVEAVRVMRRISDAVLDHMHEILDDLVDGNETSVPKVMGEATALICRSLPITKIIAVTISGFAARTIALHRPRQPLLAVSNDPIAARSFEILPGTQGVFIDVLFSKTSTDHIPACLESLWQKGLIELDDMLLVTAVAYPRSGNRMNLIQTHAVRDLAETMGWIESPEHTGQSSRFTHHENLNSQA